MRQEIWKIKTKILEKIQQSFWFVKRKIRVIWRKVFVVRKNSLTFAILCIKKTEYAKLAIDQINSMHYFNPSHRFKIYSDNTCEKFIKENKKLFDYPEQICVENKFKEVSLPWQYCKMEMIIEASALGIVCVDADTLWHSDISIKRDVIYMFAIDCKFKDNKMEEEMIFNIFGKPEWAEFNHYVSALVSIPKEFITEKFTSDCRDFLKKILNNSFLFAKDQASAENLKRISEEIALNLALQSNFPNKVQAFKKDGNSKDKKIMQPLYYGTKNKIIN